ncbi:LysE family translocator [Vibrio gazogenes]|uniref:Threonine/homoserine/homoserine lactone efflux protein n=1 Tax=Vibrio gazogenes DSM 21264 = NBRC 103151 TaxID=1123492 RepID=A0A1M4URA7_VIBGA|nr:LysE family translocator [Vibrio gazogenes]USP15698.1 LysE family translocator [Vibrio gazogenes]SHE59272.1 Threonine/homoserine/homoserine lactone efflux protein [Vibrio gazogenes DSM 21264] [Vibrio gazogenes DSM 21264 = NBRC 103151]SJN56186.1 Homoserine/homoserine lactone efflux protein [Vibrio gazogenes]
MDYFIYLGICIVATASPGPAIFLSIKNGAKYGFSKALIGVVGNVVAMLTLASVSAVGLGAVILASPLLYTAIKVIGGLYLIYLGVKAWCSKPLSHTEHTEKLVITAPSRLKIFSESYLVGISNPKAIAFYTALFPQFINLDQPVFSQFALLAGTFAVCSFLFLATYVVLASKLRKYLERKKTLVWFNRITGGVFVGFGAALVSSNHA